MSTCTAGNPRGYSSLAVSIWQDKYPPPDQIHSFLPGKSPAFNTKKCVWKPSKDICL